MKLGFFALVVFQGKLQVQYRNQTKEKKVSKTKPKPKSHASQSFLKNFPSHSIKTHSFELQSNYVYNSVSHFFSDLPNKPKQAWPSLQKPNLPKESSFAIEYHPPLHLLHYSYFHYLMDLGRVEHILHKGIKARKLHRKFWLLMQLATNSIDRERIVE